MAQNIISTCLSHVGFVASRPRKFESSLSFLKTAEHSRLSESESPSTLKLIEPCFRDPQFIVTRTYSKKLTTERHLGRPGWGGGSLITT